VLLAWPHVTRTVPAPLVALGAAAAGTALCAHFVPGFHVDTVASRFAFASEGAPLFVLPWQLPAADGRPLVLTFDVVRELAPSAFAIAMLGAIESLLCAVVADG
jgi:SulP family sulfate permease